MSLDLTRSLPAGWRLEGASQPRFDGVNWYRTLDGHATFTLTATVPSFVTLRFQTYSAGGAYALTASQDNRDLLREDVGRADFHNTSLGLRLPVGTSRVELQASCADASACLPVNLYRLSAETIAVHAAPPGTLLLSLGLAALLAVAFAWGLLGWPRSTRTSPPG